MSLSAKSLLRTPHWGYRISGQAMVDQFLQTGRRMAISAQELSAIAGALLVGAALLSQGVGLDPRGQVLGATLLIVAIPQVGGIAAGYLGLYHDPLTHWVRIVLLIILSTLLCYLALVMLIALSWWSGVAMIFSLSGAAATLHVSAYNGRSGREQLEPRVESLLMERGVRFAEPDR